MPRIIDAAPTSGRSHHAAVTSNPSAGSRRVRASQTVDPIAIAMNGTTISGCIEPIHSSSRSTKKAFVYGGGSAASFKLAVGPQMPITQHASPKTMPEPTDRSVGPSERSAEPSRNRDVTRWNPKTARSVTPNSTQVVGCVNAAAIPIRNRAVRAPHDVFAAWRNGSINASRNRTVMLSRYPTYGVVRNSATVASSIVRNATGSLRLRTAPAPRASPVRIGTPSIRNFAKV